MKRQHSGAPLRRRVLVSIMSVTALAVILFTLPLAVAVQRLYRTETVTALQRDAARAAAVVPDAIPGGPASLPRGLAPGDFTVRAERSGVREADTASQALEDTASQLGQLLERERAFSSDVSHQLRTPLTALMVGLESALTRPDADLRPALHDALSRT